MQRTFSIIKPDAFRKGYSAAMLAEIDKAGFKDYFGHGLGHGIGREIHELPSINKNAKDEELRPGMIVTVEPGIYLPGEGGVRIEDDVLITHSGCELLSGLDRSFEANHVE